MPGCSVYMPTVIINQSGSWHGEDGCAVANVRRFQICSCYRLPESWLPPPGMFQASQVPCLGYLAANHAEGEATHQFVRTHSSQASLQGKIREMDHRTNLASFSFS